MILEKDFRENDMEITGNQDESIGMSVDTESVNHLMMILSSNLYQDPIGSIIREYTSNAIDANVDAKIDDPVIVRLKMVGSNWIFEVQDYGPGLDDKDFRTIISKYGKSTKRDKADQLGYFGLGCKSGFAYTNQFHYTCIKDGIERKYLLYKGEQGFTIDLLFEQKTDKRSGVTVTIPVKNYDYDNFYRSIKTQLAYFDNVYFDIAQDKLGYSYKGEDLNKMKIFREKLFQWSNISGYYDMHITLGRVCYPINWTTLGMNRISIPVALKFDLDSGLFPIPNRENLIWNDKTKETVKKRITEVMDWFVERYNSFVKSMPNIVEAWDFINTATKYVPIEDKNFDISSYAHLSKIPLKEVLVAGITIKEPHFYKSRYDDMVKDYRIVGEMSNGVLRTKSACSYWMSSLIRKGNKVAILHDDVVIKGYFRDYLRGSGFTTFVKKKPASELKKEDLEFYKQKLWLEKEPRKLWRPIIKEFNAVRQSIIDSWKDGTKLHESKEFEDFKKNNKKKTVSKKGSTALNKQVHQVTIGFLEENYYKKYSIKRKAVDTDKLKTIGFNMVLLDGTDKNLDLLGKAFAKQKLRFVQVGVKDLKKINELKLHNFMTRKELENTKAFARVATAIFASKLCKDFENLSKNNIDIVKHCAKKYFSLYSKTKKYAEEQYEKYDDDSTERGILQIARTYNLWDKEHIGYIREFEQAIKDYDFIPMITGKADECENLVHSLMLMKKLKFADKFPDLCICVAPKKDETDLVTLQTQCLQP